VNPAGSVQASCEQLLTINDLKSEERKQKLSRYRKKKIKRNFGRKIKVSKTKIDDFNLKKANNKCVNLRI
jgi:nitrate reductase cytochrome c-type subunit